MYLLMYVRKFILLIADSENAFPDSMNIRIEF